MKVGHCSGVQEILEQVQRIQPDCPMVINRASQKA